MEAIREEAEECWMPDPEEPDLVSLDSTRFIELVRESYKYISEPDESIFYSEDGDAVSFTCDILAEQAVLHNDTNFFLKIIKETCGSSSQNDFFFAAVVKTQRFHFIQIFFELVFDEPVYYLYSFETVQQALNVIECISYIIPLDELFSLRVKRSPIKLSLALAFLQKGIPFEQVLANCDREVAAKLKEEEV